MSKTAYMNRRKQIVRRKIAFLTGATLAIVLLAGIICSTLFTEATAEDDDTYSYKYYTTIEIKDGDSLWDIANEYYTEDYTSVKDYIKEIKTVNNMTSDYIQDGENLTLPYYSSTFM